MRASAAAFVLVFVMNSPVHVWAQDDAIQQEEYDYQNYNFSRWWGTDLVWKFDDLPDKGGVESFRIPYSGFDYPDRSGGTVDVLRKYDLAFNSGSIIATQWEREDVGKKRDGLLASLERRAERNGRRPGLLAAILSGAGRGRTPEWYGHCNGRTAASIRHAEPQTSVVRNGVTFTPADIKGLLAEIYMYSENEFLGGMGYDVNPGTFHVIISNWIGRGSHPVGMDSTLGEVVYNYPIYAYKAASAKRSGNRVEVSMNVAYANSSNGEYDESPRLKSIKYFHYTLDLNDEGEIIGGRHHEDGARVDMLWVPQKPVQGGEPGNKLGNPNINVKEVLAIWRESVPEDLRGKWFNIDPTDEDRIVEPEEEEDDTEAEDGEETDGEEADGEEATGGATVTISDAEDADEADGEEADGEEATDEATVTISDAEVVESSEKA